MPPTVILPLIITLAAGYFLGSVPTGYLVGRARGLDLRTLGSGNIGATNALRILGKPAGIAVLVVDALKGLLAATLVPALVARWFPSAAVGETGAALLGAAGGIGSVLGHNFTCWLRFKGGKGVATSAGVLAGLLPWAFLAVLGVFLLTLALTRTVSLGSIAGAVALPIATALWHRQPLLLGFSVILAALAIWRHRANITRLLAGTEPRLGQRRDAPPPTPTGPQSNPPSVPEPPTSSPP